MTENEANERWCPFARVGTTHTTEPQLGPAINRNGARMDADSPGIPDGRCRCIASDCMAWRWHYSAYHGRHDSGYCGLAGKPDLA